MRTLSGNVITTGLMLLFYSVQAQQVNQRTPPETYRYQAAPGAPPDVAILPLGNATGRIMAFEIPGGLPIIFDVRSPSQSTSVIAGDKEFVLNYTSATGETRDSLKSWKGGGGDYEKSMILNDGIQPVVSYSIGGEKRTCWPYDLKNVSREWVQTSNVLKTVMQNGEIELTAVDFIAADKDLLVRKISVKNISKKPLSRVTLFHYAPVNPSGRKSSAGWEKGWYTIQPENESHYDATTDCLAFTGKERWWLLGSHEKSVFHHCDSYPNTREEINNGSVANSDSSKGVVDGALGYGDKTLTPGSSYTVDFFLACIDKKEKVAALAEFKTTYLNRPAAARLSTTLDFWKAWFAKGRIPVTPDKKLNEYIRRELMLIKTQEYWTGGLPSDAFELPDYYFRDAARPALAFAEFGYKNEAESIMLALAAIAQKNGYCNHYHGIAQWIKDGTINGLPKNAVIKPTEKYSADDPGVFLTMVDKIYAITKDKSFVAKLWPLIPYTVAIARRDLGTKGTVAQIQGFQDDMIHWAQRRPDVKQPGEKGVECSYWNMFWVAGIEGVARMAADLGHSSEAADYTAFAATLRQNIEQNLWDSVKKRYCYYYNPAGNDYVFLTNKALSHGGGIAIQSGYLPPAAGHAKSEWLSVKAAVEPLPEGDVVTNKFSASGVSVARYLYGKVYSGDADVKKTVDWVINSVPFGGLSEYLPFHHRVQVWTRGEMLMSLYEFIKLYYPQSLRRKK